ncbi:hypothetical protein HYT57_04210, partial [Candidatus Woesearchaeota archaeon]|nr:hypothetical protein [Candidatus Woesearchaeota archaeon]
WQNKFADENSLFKRQDVQSLDKYVENTINEYISPKAVPLSKLAPNLLSEAAGSTRKVLGGIVIAGLLFAGGYFLGKHSDPKQPTAQVSGSYSPIANAYAEQAVQEPIVQEPVKEQLANIPIAIQEQEAETKTNFIKIEPYPTKPNVNYTHETNKKSSLEHRLELARLNHDEIAVSEYQQQLKDLTKPKESKKERLKDKPKTKNWFFKDIDDWAKDILSPLRFDRLISKKKREQNEYSKKFLIFGKDSYHHQHPIKAIGYDVSAYTVGNGVSNLVSGEGLSRALIGEGRGGLGIN